MTSFFDTPQPVSAITPAPKHRRAHWDGLYATEQTSTAGLVLISHSQELSHASNRHY